MDWELAIRRNYEDLAKIVGMIFAAMGIAAGTSVETLPRRVYYAAQRILRPAESAMRRLIFLRMRRMTMPEQESRSGPKSQRKESRVEYAERTPAFRLIDPRKTFDERPRTLKSVPNIWTPGVTERWKPEEKPPLSDDDPIDTKRLFRRLSALQNALDDLPGQARRMARLMAKRANAPPGPGCVPPLRPGWPPGYRQRHVHPVDRVLSDCQSLVRYAIDLDWREAKARRLKPG